MFKTDFDLKLRTNQHILVVDDDVDAAALIASVFSQLGCETVCTLTPKEAKERICSMKDDIIILDWILDDCTDAKAVMDTCGSIFTKFGVHRSNKEKPKIITYSSLELSEIEFLKSPHFQHLDHWQKPLSYHEILKRSLKLLQKTGT